MYVWMHGIAVGGGGEGCGWGGLGNVKGRERWFERTRICRTLMAVAGLSLLASSLLLPPLLLVLVVLVLVVEEEALPLSLEDLVLLLSAFFLLLEEGAIVGEGRKEWERGGEGASVGTDSKRLFRGWYGMVWSS